MDNNAQAVSALDFSYSTNDEPDLRDRAIARAQVYATLALVDAINDVTSKLSDIDKTLNAIYAEMPAK